MKSVRISIFVGEPLWYEQVRDWVNCCKGSVVYNTYGPTETTVIIMRYKVYDPKTMTIDNLQNLEGVVPLGTTFPRAKAAIFDDNNVEAKENEIGQIYLSGDQVGLGYLNSKERQVKHLSILMEPYGIRLVIMAISIKKEILFLKEDVMIRSKSTALE